MNTKLTVNHLFMKSDIVSDSWWRKDNSGKNPWRSSAS